MPVFTEALEQQLLQLRLLTNGAANIWWEAMTAEERRHQADVVGIALSNGAPYYWAPDLCHVLEAAAQSMPMTWLLEPQVLQSPHGFMWFAEPLQLVKRSDQSMDPLRAVSWSRLVWDPDFKGQSRVVDRGANNTADGAWFTAWVTQPESSETRQSLWPVTTWPWRFNQTISDVLDVFRQSTPDDRRVRQRQKACIVGAALALLEQEVFSVDHALADRGLRRRLAHAGEPDPPLIRVVRLRRQAVRHPLDDSAGAEIEWSCQWLVRGHWRQQWCPGAHHHELRWIAPYTKGPADKPLKAPSATLFAVVR
jgi:hypothetical protein